MNNIQIIQAIQPDGSFIDFVMIETAPGEYTSMPKEYYDKMIADQESAGK